MNVMNTLEEYKKTECFRLRMVIYIQAFVVLQVKKTEWSTYYDL